MSSGRHSISIDPELLFKPIKINTSNVLWQGCWHLAHDPVHWDVPIWKTRGYNSAEEHFHGLINNWNSVANDETIGFSLGDSAFGNKAFDNLKFFLESIKFKTIYLMSGNHSASWTQILDGLDSNIWRIADDKHVILVPNYLETFVCGQPIVNSHYPILGQNGAARGSWMLHAHVHGNLGKSEIGKLYQSRGKNKEVSVEVAPIPLSFKDLQEYFKDRENFAPDHHTASTQNPF